MRDTTVHDRPINEPTAQPATDPAAEPSTGAPHADGPGHLHRPDPERVMAAIGRRSFATLATASPAGRPHAAGVLYELVGDELFVSTLRSSRKARNVEANGRAGVTIPIRRLPIGPPSTVQFQAIADVLDTDDPTIGAVLAAGHLRSITGHGELELPDGCFLRIALPERLHTYGLGMSLRSLLRDPIGAAGIVEREASRAGSSRQSSSPRSPQR